MKPMHDLCNQLMRGKEIQANQDELFLLLKVFESSHLTVLGKGNFFSISIKPQFRWENSALNTNRVQ